MELTITGHHVDVTPALRSYTEEKFEPLQRHFERIGTIHVVFNIENLNKIAEATMHVPGADLHAKADDKDMYAAIDLLAMKLNRQLIKHKERLQNHKGE